MDESPVSLDEWVRTVEAGLGGRGYASLFWQTPDGFGMPPLTTAAEIEALPHVRATALLAARRGFAIRALITAPDPARSGVRARRALARGADQIEFGLDAVAQDALEPGVAASGDDDVADPATPGDGGVAIHTRADLDAVLDGLDLAATHVSFSAGEGALPVLAWWLRRAEELGVRPADLRGDLDVDPIARLTMRQVELSDEDCVLSQRAAIEPVFGETVAAIVTCRDRAPGIRPVAIDGQTLHLAGAPASLEIGATIASTIEIARRVGERGVCFDDFANAATVRVQVGHEIPLEIAKLRALRLLWAKVAHAFGGSLTAATARVLGLTSGRFRAEDYDQRTNLIRSMAAGFAAVTGGCDAVISLPFDDGRDEKSTDLARDQLQLLRAEAHLDRVADPAHGSHAIEKLTDEIARAAWSVVQEIEREGGLLATVRNGFLGERLRIAEEQRERAFRTRRRVLVGVSRFADPELGGPGVHGESDDATMLLERHSKFLATRDAAAARRLIEAIGASSAERFFEHALGAGADHATLAELATATWPPEGVTFEHLFLPIAVEDGHEFEDLRSTADTARADGIAVPSVMLVPFGTPKAARARAGFARDLFLAGGFEVADPGLFERIDTAIDAIIAADPVVVVLCSDDAAYSGAVESLRARLGDAAPRLIVAGRADEALAQHIDGAVHVGVDVVGVLADLQAELGLAGED